MQETKYLPDNLANFKEVVDTFLDLLDLGISMTEQVLLRTIANRTQKIFGKGEASIFLISRLSNGIVINYQAGSSDITSQKLKSFQFKVGEGIIGWTIKTGEAQLVPDVQNLHYSETGLSFMPVADKRSNYITRSVACSPIKIGQEVIGAIEIVAKQPNQFSNNDLNLLNLIAKFSAVAIKQVRYLDSEKRRSQFLNARALVISDTVPNFDNLDQLLKKMVKSIRDNFQFYFVGVYLVDETRDQNGRQWTKLKVASGQDEEKVHELLQVGRQLEVDTNSMVGWTTKYGKPRISLHIDDDKIIIRHIDPPRLEPPQDKFKVVQKSKYLPKTQSSIAMPLTAYGEVIGAITVQSEDPGYFSEENFSNEDVHMLQALIEQLAFVIYNARIHQQIKFERQILEILQAIDKKIIGTTNQNLKENLQFILTKGVELIGAEFGQIFLYSENTETLIEHASTTQYSVNKKLKLGQSVCGRAVLSKSSILIDDLDDSKYLEIYQASVANVRMKSELVVLLTANNQVLGVFNAESSQPKAFNKTHQEIIESLAAQAAIAVQNAYLFERAAHQTLLLKAASEVSRNVISIHDLDRLLARTVEIIIEKFGFYYAGIFLVDEQKDWAILRAGSGEAGQKMLKEGHQLKIGGRSMVGQATGLRKARITSNTGKEKQHFKNPYLPETRSEMALPLSVKEGKKFGVIGALTVQSTEEDAFSEEDVDMLQAMADQLAVAINNARLHQQLEAHTQQIEEHIHHLGVLREIDYRIVSPDESIEEILKFVLEKSCQLTGAESGQIFLLNEENELKVEIATKNSDLNDRVPIERGTIIGDAVFGKQRILVSDISKLQRSSIAEEQEDEDDYTHAYKIDKLSRAAAAILQEDGGVIGVLSVEHSNSNQFTMKHLDVLSDLAGQAAVAIKNRILIEQSKKRAKHSEATAQVGADIISVLNVEKLLNKTVQLIHDKFELYYAAIFLIEEIDDKGKRWRIAKLKAASGAEGHKLLEKSHQLEVGGNSMVGYTTSTGRARIALDVNEESVRFQHPDLQMAHSEMALPLRNREGIIGALDVQSIQKGAFSPGDIQTLQTMADQLATAIYNAQLYQRTEEHRQQLLALREIDHTIISKQQSLNDTLKLILDKALGLTEAHQGSLLLIEADQTNLRVCVSSKPEEIGSTLPISRIPGLVVQRQQSIVVPEVFLEADHQVTYNYFGPNPASALLVPLREDKKVMGILNVYTEFSSPTDYFNPFSERQQAILEALASQAAIAIKNAQLFENEQKRSRDNHTLLRVAQHVSSSLQIDEIMDTILDDLKDVIVYDSASIQLMKDESLEIVKYRGFLDPIQVLGQSFLRDSNTPNAEIMRTQSSLLLTDTKGTYPNFDEEPTNRIRSWLGVPLLFKDKLLGIITVDSQNPNSLSQDQVELTQAFASQVASALENAKLFEQQEAVARENAYLFIQAERRATLLKAAAQVSHSITSVFDLDELLYKTVDTICNEFRSRQFYYAAVFLTDEIGEYVFLRAGTGEIGQKMVTEGLKFKIGSGDSMVGAVTQSGQALIELNVQSDEDHYSNPKLPDTKSEMALPLKISDTVIGALTVHSKEVNAFSDEDIQILQSMADQLAIAIDNVRKQKQLLDAETMRSIAETISQSMHWVANKMVPINIWINWIEKTLGSVINKYDINPEIKEGFSEAVEIIKENTNLILKVKTELMGAAREFELSNVNLENIIREVVRNLDFPTNNIKLDIAQDLPPIWADRIAVKEVFTNLFVNAIHALKDVKAPILQITTCLAESREFVEVKITDNGPGIPSDKIKDIWKPFYTTKAGEGGTGIGLSYCLQAIHKMGGKISVESEVGKGTTFILEFWS